MATLVALNVGLPNNVSWQDRTVHTGIWKAPADGPRMVRRLNVDGDGQGRVDLPDGVGRSRTVSVVLDVEIAGYPIGLRLVVDIDRTPPVDRSVPRRRICSMRRRTGAL
jgi:hypothetical protein